MNKLPWWSFPLLLSIISPLATAISNKYGMHTRFLFAWTFLTGIILQGAWFFIFRDLKGEDQARAVAFSIIFPMVFDTLIIYYLEGGLTPVKLTACLIIFLGALLLYLP